MNTYSPLKLHDYRAAKMAAFYPNSRRMSFATIIMVLGTLILARHASAQLCNANLSGLISECQKYVQKSGPEVPPSSECCAIVKPINVPCVCAFITKDIENMVNMDKVVYVARSCGKTIKPGMKCGDYTVPGA